jgi:hypothetical protein
LKKGMVMNRFKLMSITVGLLWCTNGCAITTQYISQASIGTTGYTIAQPGHYVVTENITFSPLATATAIMITTSGVTLDLNNYFIQQGSVAAAVNGVTVANSLMDIVIKNGTISRFTSDCVRLLSGSNVITLSNLQCLNSTARYGLLADGLLVDGSYVSDIVIADCLCKGNFLGGGFFFAVNGVAMYNTKFNDNVNLGLVASSCVSWNLENCQFNKNFVATALATSVTGLLANSCLAFSIENCQCNDNIYQGLQFGAAAGLNAISCSGWTIRNSSFNNNTNDSSIALGGQIAGATISTPAVDNGFILENCNFLANIATSTTNVANFSKGVSITAGGEGVVLKGCKFIGNRVINPSGNTTSTVFGFDSAARGTQITDSLAYSNLVQNDSVGTGFRCTGIGVYFFNCQAINNGCVTGGSGIGFDVGIGNSSLGCVIRNSKAYAEQGTTTFGFRDQSSVVQNWYAGNESYANATNYNAIITGGARPPIVLSRDSNPTYTVFDARGLDNINIP